MKLQEGVRGDHPTIDAILKIISKIAVATSFCLFLATAAFSDDDEWVPVNPFSGDEEVIDAGRTLFNVHCAHCHGFDAIQGIKKRDLRRLTVKYKDRVTKVFLTTALMGRLQKGMPPWGEIFEEDVLWTIYSFLETVQKKKK